MNLKWKKKYLGPILGLVGAVVLIGGVYLYSSSNIQPDHQKEFNQTSKKVTKPKEKAIDLSGDYVSNERDEAKIEKKARPGRSITKRLMARYLLNLVRIGRSKGLIKFRQAR